MGSKRSHIPQQPASKVPLHVADSFDTLEELAKKNETPKLVKKKKFVEVKYMYYLFF